jgi:predicted nucleic acid-binding protein
VESDDDCVAALADACIVRVAEIYQHYTVLTLDSDFPIYPLSRADRRPRK